MAVRVRDDVVEQVLDVPADRLASVIGSWQEPALLESGPGFGEAGRWSILTARPILAFEATGNRWWLSGCGMTDEGKGDVLAKLGWLTRRLGLAEPTETPDPDLPPFQGGLIGYIGYDFAPQLERLPRRLPRDSRMPDIRLAYYNTAVTIDRRSGVVQLWAWYVPGLDHASHAVRFYGWKEQIERELKSPGPGTICPPKSAQPVSAFDREAYCEAVRRVLEYIAAGDVFQINLSQRFTAIGPFDPLDLYLRLKRRSPAPFAAFLRWKDMAIVSASPESFYQTRGDRIVTRPIKGTRPRGWTRAEDERAAAELLASSKDRAELTMIVDLERNDLGRICQYGSVLVRDALSLESFAQVHHLVATVEGRLRPEVGPDDVIRAVFPGGSITGAPKIRAMEIIDELEPNRRSLYTGAIGYLSRGGSSAFNIAIRTILVEGDRASYQVGGGIVADSDPESEYEETLAKARGMQLVLEGGANWPLVWSNGEIIPPEAVSIDVLDETFQHGLGLFETFRTWKGYPTLFPHHRERMRCSARELGLGLLRSSQWPDRLAVHKLIAEHIQHAPEPVEAVRIRITLSGGRFTPNLDLRSGVLWMSVGTLSAPTTNRAAVIKRCIQVTADDPLARHKTLNYWRKRIAWNQALAEGADEVLCVTPDQFVCEGTRTNIFLVDGKRLVTPSTDGPLLPGIMRRVVLDHARRLGFEVTECLVPMDALSTADEAFLTNSVQGMLPISRLFDRVLPAPGPVTERLWSEILPWLESGGPMR